MADTVQNKLLDQIPASSFIARRSLLLDPKQIEEREYWVKRLGRVGERGRLWAEGERGQGRGWGRWEGQITGKLWERMLRVTEGGALLLYTTVVAGLKICLARNSGSELVVTGSPERRAKGGKEGSGSRAGSGNNLLAVVDQVRGEQRVEELLQQVKSSLVEAYGRQQYGVERLVKELGLEGAEELFDVVVRYSELHEGQEEREREEEREGKKRAGVMIGLERTPAGLKWVAEYEEREGEGRGERVRGLLGQMEAVLEQMVAHPERRIGELSLLSEEERERVLVEWNGT